MIVPFVKDSMQRGRVLSSIVRRGIAAVALMSLAACGSTSGPAESASIETVATTSETPASTATSSAFPEKEIDSLPGELDSPPRCGPPDNDKGNDRICIDGGYFGPMTIENLAPFIGLTLPEARTLAAERDWSIVVRDRDDGVEIEPIDDSENFDRFGVWLRGGRIVQVRPG